MGLDTNAVSLLILLGIPGVLCKDDYDVGGMVAAAAAGALFIVAVIIMGLFICFWPDYYHKQQLLRGRVRVARPKRKKWRWWSSKNTVTSRSTEHKRTFIPMYEMDGLQKPSQHSTLQGRQRAETWMQKLPYDTHETKQKTITLEPEEEPVIVADVLPAGTTENIETARKQVVNTHYQTTPTQYTVSDAEVLRYTTGPYTTTETGRYTDALRYTTTDAGRTQYTTNTESLEPIHIKLETQGTNDLRSSHLRTTQLRTTQGGGERIVLQEGQRPEDIIITPIIPSTSQDFQGGQTYQYQYQRTDYQSNQPDIQVQPPSPQEQQPKTGDEAVIQFGDGESHHD